VTGEPVARALVQISGSGNQAMLTTPEGSFEFANLGRGQVAVMARKPGFFSPADAGSGSAAVQQLVQVGPDMPPVTLRLLPQAVIRGRVEAEGEAVEALQIRAYSAVMQEGRRRWEQRGFGVTDENGGFRVANLLPGSYYLVAGPTADTQNVGAFVPDDGYAVTFYPGVGEISAASPVEVSAGQQAEISFSLKRSPLFHVTGIVGGAPAGQTPSFQVEDWTGEELPVSARFDPASGRFDALMRAGTYTLEAAVTQADRPPLMAFTPLIVAGEQSDVRLMLAPLATIPVNVKQQVASGAVTQAGRRDGRDSMGPALAVRLISATSSQEYFANARGPAALVFDDVMPGRYKVRIDAQPFWYVQSAFSGPVDLLREELVVGAGGRLSAIEIELRDDSGSIHGTLTADGRPAAGSILAVPDFAPQQIKVVSADKDGSFEIRSLAPGEYNLLGFDRIDGLEYENPEVLGQYLARAGRVTVSARARVNVNATLLHVGN
jgi:hypothetical protein